MKIFLIGMPGSGKTTLGKQLAERLAVDFVDLDAEIEKTEVRSIAEIFREKGEDHFRLLEAKLLREWAAGSRGFVMATGGGAPCFHRGIDVINANGLSVFLDCSVSKLVERVKLNKDRPLLASSEEAELRLKLERMLSARIDCYRQAKFILQEPSLGEVLMKLKIKT